MKICISLYVTLLIITTGVYGQTDAVAKTDSTSKKKKLNLSFRFDYGLNKQPAFIKTRYFYEGEYVSSQSNNEWIWAEQDRPIFNDGDIRKQLNYKFDLMLSITEQINFGLSYKVLVVKKESFPWGGGGLDDIFFSIAGTVDYEWQIPKVKNLYLNPTFSIGGFQDNYLFGRTGANLYYDAKLALFYRLFDKLGIRAWASYDHFMYRKKIESEVFPGRERIEKLDFQYINYGLGLSYRFFIYPD